MIAFGDGWIWEAGRLEHACGPDVVFAWSGERCCPCGAPVPRHALWFQRWLRREEALGSARQRRRRAGGAARAYPAGRSV